MPAAYLLLGLRDSYMRFFQPAISLVCVFLLAVPPAGAQTAVSVGPERQGFFARITDPYRRHPVAPVNLRQFQPAGSAAASRPVVSVPAGHHRPGAREQSRYRAAALWRPDRRREHPPRPGGRPAARRHRGRHPGSIGRARRRPGRPPASPPAPRPKPAPPPVPAP